MDFEKAAINAVQNINNRIQVKGCFYHLSSNVWKRIQQFGLQQRYNDDQDQEFALNLRMLCAAAFLLPAQVIEGFENLADNLRNLYDNEVDELLEYFENN